MRGKDNTQQELPIDVSTSTKLPERFCYFLRGQPGPNGFESCTLLTFSFEWDITGFAEDLKLTIPAGSFIFNKVEHNFLLKDSAISEAKNLARQYQYTIVG